MSTTPTARKLRKTRIGTVVSDRAAKTLVVAIERLVKHPLYGKFIRKTTKVMAHDPSEQGQRGDTVKLMETRPLSKHKRWRLVQVIEKRK